MERGPGLILALDVLDRKEALEIVDATRDYIRAVKVGYPLVLSTGLDIISKIKEKDLCVIADFKVADVPHVSREICRLATDAGADYVIIQGVMGRDVMKSCSEVADIIVVADMSHLGALDYLTHHNQDIARASIDLAKGIVAPATRPQIIKSLKDIVGELTIISPGVKAQGAKVGAAIEAGADFEIIGRAIYQSKDPRKEAMSINKSIEAVKKNE